jgi:hypothetical protein
MGLDLCELGRARGEHDASAGFCGHWLLYASVYSRELGL